jgi:hypothetical protein
VRSFVLVMFVLLLARPARADDALLQRAHQAIE